MTVKYKLAENKGRASNGEVVYIGQLIHNGVLDMDAMSCDYARRFNVSEAAARYQLECLGQFIAEEIQTGKKLKFNAFSVSLKMTGTFSRGNVRYDAQKNPIRVVMTPTKVLQRAAAVLEPVNGTEKMNPRIDLILHDTIGMEGKEYPPDVIRLDGARTTMNVTDCMVDGSAPDEGVFLTPLADETPLLTAEIDVSTTTMCDVRFPKSDLPAGEYNILIRSRGGKGLPLVVAKRKVTVRGPSATANETQDGNSVKTA